MLSEEDADRVSAKVSRSSACDSRDFFCYAWDVYWLVRTKKKKRKEKQLLRCHICAGQTASRHIRCYREPMAHEHQAVRGGNSAHSQCHAKRGLRQRLPGNYRD